MFAPSSLKNFCSIMPLKNYSLVKFTHSKNFMISRAKFSIALHFFLNFLLQFILKRLHCYSLSFSLLIGVTSLFTSSLFYLSASFADDKYSFQFFFYCFSSDALSNILCSFNFEIFTLLTLPLNQFRFLFYFRYPHIPDKNSVKTLFIAPS